MAFPDNATIVQVEGTDEFYIRVDKGGVSFFFKPDEQNINSLINNLGGEDPAQIKKSVETVSEEDFEGSFIDDDYLVYMGDYDTLTEDFETILNNLSDISATETWWGNPEFRKIYEKEYMLNLSANDGVFNSNEFFASLKENPDIDNALGPGVRRSQFNRAVDYRLDGVAYEESLEVKIGTILSTAAKAGLNPDTLKDNPQLDNSLKLIAKNFNDGVYGDPALQGTMTKVVQQINALIDPEGAGQFYNLDEDIKAASKGMSDFTITTKQDEVKELLNTWVPQTKWGNFDIGKEAGKLRANPEYETELIEKMKDARFAEYSMYDRETSWSTILANKKASVMNVWGIDVGYDSPVLHEVIKLNDSAAESKYLRGKGLELGIQKVVNDQTLSEMQAYGEGVIASAGYTEG